MSLQCDFKICEPIRTDRSTRGVKSDPPPFGPKGAEFFHPRHPGQPKSTRVLSPFHCVSFFFARAVAPHTGALAAQPYIYVPAVVRHRRPAVFLREGPEAIRDPSWSRCGREENEGPRAQAALFLFGSIHHFPYLVHFGAQQHLCKRSSTIMHYNRPKSDPTASHDIGKMVYLKNYSSHN